MKTSRLLTTTSFATLLSSLALVACGAAEVEPAAQRQSGLTPAEPEATTPAPEAMRPEPGEHRRRHGMRGNRGHGPPSPEKMLERFDTNKNGTLEAAELPERMQQHIGDIDKSGDSVVTKDELEAHFKSRFADHAKKRFEKKDANSDGFLDQAELGDKWSKLSVADQNGDQKLTPDELKTAFESGKLKPMGFGKGRGKPHKQ
jgi:hypothetical protein